MITGFDSVVVTARPPGPAIARFLRQWSHRWPDMRIAVSGEPEEPRFVRWCTDRPDIPEASGDILVAWDERTLSDWNEHGYELPDSPIGPFALCYQPCPATEFPALVQRDPYARDPAYRFEPYPVTVVGAGLWLVTVVTPDEESAFSRSVINTVIAALNTQDG